MPLLVAGEPVQGQAQARLVVGSPPVLVGSGAERMSRRSAINVVATPSHWITAINVQVDAATREEPQANLKWMLRCPYAYLPPVRYQDHSQLAPTDPQEWCARIGGVSCRHISLLLGTFGGRPPLTEFGTTQQVPCYASNLLTHSSRSAFLFLGTFSSPTLSQSCTPRRSLIRELCPPGWCLRP